MGSAAETKARGSNVDYSNFKFRGARDIIGEPIDDIDEDDDAGPSRAGSSGPSDWESKAAPSSSTAFDSPGPGPRTKQSLRATSKAADWPPTRAASIQARSLWTVGPKGQQRSVLPDRQTAGLEPDARRFAAVRNIETSTNDDADDEADLSLLGLASSKHATASSLARARHESPLPDYEDPEEANWGNEPDLVAGEGEEEGEGIKERLEKATLGKRKEQHDADVDAGADDKGRELEGQVGPSGPTVAHYTNFGSSSSVHHAGPSEAVQNTERGVLSTDFLAVQERGRVRKKIRSEDDGVSPKNRGLSPAHHSDPVESPREDVKLPEGAKSDPVQREVELAASLPLP